MISRSLYNIAPKSIYFVLWVNVLLLLFGFLSKKHIKQKNLEEIHTGNPQDNTIILVHKTLFNVIDRFLIFQTACQIDQSNKVIRPFGFLRLFISISHGHTKHEIK